MGILAFASLMVLNFAQSERRYLLDSLASSSSSKPSTSSGKSTSSSKGTGSSSSSSSSSSSGTSTSPSNPCCKGWKFWASCDQKKVVSKVTIDCTIETTTYYFVSGAPKAEVKKYGTYISTVSAELKAKATRHETVTTGMAFESEVVTCPTSGICNDCDEYRPGCEA